MGSAARAAGSGEVAARVSARGRTSDRHLLRQEWIMGVSKAASAASGAYLCGVVALGGNAAVLAGRP